MKKIFLIGALALFGVVNAQKNTLLVGGNISYQTATNKSNGTTTSDGNAFEFNPTIGYQFSDNWTAGIRLGIGTNKIAGYQTILGTVYNMEDKTTTFTYGVFGRYTLPLSDIFSVYGDLDIFAGNGKKTTSSNVPGFTTTTTETTAFGVQFTPNLFINFKNSFGLNFNIGGLGYTSEKTKGTDDKVNAFGFGFGKGVTVGISKNFGLKK